MADQVSRRQVLLGGVGAALLPVMVTGCDALSTDPSTGNRQRGPSRGSDAKEAPMLSGLVKAGELPPLAERLPDRPLVVEPVERPGVYGGTWTTALLGPEDTPWLDKTVHYECLMRWRADFTEPIPNIAENVEVDEGGRVFTFRLRRGMRWSNGEPFTSADVVFAVKDVLLNDELYPVAPAWLLAGDEPPRVEAPDEQTVRFTFAHPNGLFLQNLASLTGAPLTSRPRHYLERFHQAYNPKAAKLAESEGLSGWTDLFFARASAPANPDLPGLYPWIYTTALGEGTRMVAERNPYYWKTDPAGRQLPYIDHVVFEIVGNEQVILLKASNGELGMHARHVNTLRNKPVLARSRESGKFDFFELVPAIMNDLIIQLNLTHKDPVLREIFQSKDFRVGLSYAINREELIDAVLQGQGEPWQAAPRRESEFFDEEFAKQYTEFDLDKANEHLDRAGFAARDRQGFRLRPDGKRLRFAVEVPSPALKDFWVDALQLIKSYWEKAGVHIDVKTEDRTLFYKRKDAGEHDAVVWQGPGGLQDAILDPRCYFPFSSESAYAVAWAAWFTSRGARGEEPPKPAKRQMELYRQLETALDKAEQARLFEEILAVAKEQFWLIGTVQPAMGYGIVANDFHNVPATMPDANVYATPGPTNPEQYFITDS